MSYTESYEFKELNLSPHIRMFYAFSFFFLKTPERITDGQSTYVQQRGMAVEYKYRQ